MAKEAEICDEKGLHMWQKRPKYMVKERETFNSGITTLDAKKNTNIW